MIGLVLQPAQAIRAFFEGRWLEWYVFMQVPNLCVERGAEFSCARNVEMGFLNDDHRELDVVFLLNKRFPIVIECKSGEFRPDIEKYVKLRRRLGLERDQVIICNPDLADDQASGLTAMYDLTFANLESLSQHINVLVTS